MWFFSKRRDQAEQAVIIARLRAELDDLGESYSEVVSRRASAETAMRKMQKAMTDEGVAEIAKTVTARIADIYAEGRGGVKTRDIAVHSVVASAIREAVRGEAHWNEARLAADAHREVG